MKLTNAHQTLAAVFTVALTAIGFTAHAENIPGVAEQPASYFYTGKPYDADLGEYTFLARNYNPKINRWTSSDPSGFPDGANNQVYAPLPTTQFDPTGLSKMSSYTGTMHWYDGNPRPETFTEQFNDYYPETNLGPSDFSGFLGAFYTANDGDTITVTQTYNWGDSAAIGRGLLSLTGTVTFFSDPAYADQHRKFEGTITLLPDTFNFDSREWGERSYANELLTRLLANTIFNPNLGGAAFDLTFSGSKDVTYE